MKLSVKNAIKIVVSIGLIVFALMNASCDKGSKSGAAMPRATALQDSKLAMKSYNTAARADSVYFDNAEYEMLEEEAVTYGNSENPVVPEPVEGGSGAQKDAFERKLIRTGNVSLEVLSVSDAEEKITAWAKGLGGYITNANTWEGGASFTVRVPSARFDDAMVQTGDFGKVTNRSVNSQDVSDNYYDLQSRLQTKYILRDKLTGYLSQAKDIKDLLEVERQLNSVLEDIDSTESRFKRLAGQVDYSTIYIDMHFARGKDETGIILPDVKDSWNEFVSNVIGFFWGLLKILFYIVIFGIPLVAVAAFFFWLLFGKVGLLVKLFKKLKK